MAWSPDMVVVNGLSLIQNYPTIQKVSWWGEGRPQQPPHKPTIGTHLLTDNGRADAHCRLAVQAQVEARDTQRTFRRLTPSCFFSVRRLPGTHVCLNESALCMSSSTTYKSNALSRSAFYLAFTRSQRITVALCVPFNSVVVVVVVVQPPQRSPSTKATRARSHSVST
jgi:hypothetical protein